MQTNHSPTFAPRGRQGQTIPAYFADRPFFEDHELASRNTLTPRLSYTSTPESAFSTFNHVQPFRNGHDLVTRSDTERSMLAQYPEVRSSSHNSLKRESQTFPLGDWLSEPSQSHALFESPSIQALHSPQPTIPHEQYFGQSAFSPRQTANNDANTLSPSHVHAQYHYGMQQQSPTNMFGQGNSNDLFMLPPASIEVNDPFHVDGVAFSTGFVPGSYLAPAHPFHEDFDFNTSAVYPSMQHTTDYAPYGLPQASNLLPTQSDIATFAGQQTSNSRSRLKASDLDELLIKWRGQGVTYKDIMKRGDWGLSESTLRGRYRTLTKDKRLRPRKPNWDNAALSALVTAVDRFAPPSATSTRTGDSGGKIPWKKVTEWMHEEKDTHKYGFATVKKKYEQLVGDRQMQREVNQWRLANGEHPFTR